MSSGRRVPLRKNQGPVIDMFPFLGIIVCVIGVAMFLISGVVAVDGLTMDQGPGTEKLERAIHLAEGMAARANENSRISAEIRKSEETLGQHEAFEKKLAAAKSQTEGLKNELNGPEIKDRARLQEKINQMELELAGVERELARMPFEIENAKREVSNSKDSVTLPLIGKSGEGVIPIWVECHTAGITIYRAKEGQPSQTDVSLDEIEQSSEIKQILDEASPPAVGGGEMVVNLLVRTNGVEAYDKVMKRISDREVPYSAIPIVRSGKIRFRESALGQSNR